VADMNPQPEPGNGGDLVSRLRTGDSRAYRELMHTYERRLFAFAYGFLRQNEDAMDVVQETFLRVCKNIGTFKGESAFTTWLYRITRNLCIDRLRKKNRVSMGEYNDELSNKNEAVDKPVLVSSISERTPVKDNLRRELREVLFTALESLNETHREILLLRELEGLSYGEIAEMLDIPIGTVMSRIHHARKKVQQQLKPYLEPETSGARYGKK